MTTPRRLLSQQDGNIAMLFALLLIPIFAAIGLAIDSSRAYNVKMALNNSLDAAALIGGKNMNAANRNQMIQNLFDANWEGANRFGATVSALNIQADPNDGTLRISATATVPVIFAFALGTDYATVGAETQIKRTDRVLELALAIDTTGSMRCAADAAQGCPNNPTMSRMQAVQQSTTELLDMLYGAKTTDPKLFISLVPFISNVNAGNSYTNWVDAAELASVPWGAGPFPSSEGWRGCVRENLSHDTTEDPPTSFKFRPHYAQPTTQPVNLGPLFGYGSPYYLSTYVAGQSPIYGSGRNSGCGQPIIPMTNARTPLQTAINAMKPSLQYICGPGQTNYCGSISIGYSGTLINLGLEWAWRTLSPEWRGLWSGVDAARPWDYNDEDENVKAIILLTDGENEFTPGVMTGMGMIDFDGTNYTLPELGISSANIGTAYAAANTAINSRVTDVCNAARAKGVYIYAVVYALPAGASTTRDLMRDCAGDDTRFFDTSNASELKNAFKTIAQELTSLRITQ